MKINTLLLTFTSVVLGLTQPVYASLRDYIEVELQNKTYYDYETSDANVLSSSLNIGLGNSNISVDSYLREFSIPWKEVKSISKYIVDVRVSLSMAPALLKNKTINKLEAKVGDILKEKEPFIRAQVSAGVEQALLVDPQFLALSSSVQGVVKNQLINETTAKTIEDLREASNDKNSERVDQLQLETSFQEVTFNIAKQLTHSSVLFLKLGKYQQSVGTGLDALGQTKIDSIRLGRSRTQRMSSAGKTLGLTAGVIKRQESYSVQAELAIFHDRIPFLDANQYISQVVTLSDDEYEQHKDLDEIDSARFRVNIKSKKIDVYVLGGSFDGDKAYATGVLIKFFPRLKLHSDFSYSERPQTAKRAISTYLSYDDSILNYPTSLYMGTENIKDLPVIGKDSREDIVEKSVGGKVSVWRGKYRSFQSELFLNIEYFQRKNKTKGSDSEGFRGGGQFRLFLD